MYGLCFFRWMSERIALFGQKEGSHDSSYAYMVCIQAIRVVCRPFLYSIHQSTGLKGIMKRLWTMSWDLELCVYPTMYGKNELCTACAFSDGCPKGLRYSVKKKVVMTHSMHTCVCVEVIRVVCRPYLYSVHTFTKYCQ